MANPITQVALHERTLLVDWVDGRRSHYHYLWLRDNAPDAIDTHNGQRLIESVAIPPAICPQTVTLHADGQLEVVWAVNGSRSLFAPDWLRAHDYSQPETISTANQPLLWDATLGAHLPSADYPAVVDDRQILRDWLQAVHDYGFALLRQVPVASAALLKVVALFGYVRETNYGPYFDVKSVVSPNNLAYTGLGLSPHTDNPYRDPAPTLQLLHCLQDAAAGGDSIVVDGFAVAARLRQQAPEHFALLTRTPVTFRFRDQTTDLMAVTPLIALDSQGLIKAIRYNNRSLAPLALPPEQIEPFYAAYRALGELIASAEFQVVFKLHPGDLFIVDNERVLHGRTAFSNTGNRHLQGCYADRDGLLSTLRVLGGCSD
jgi:gamma-butyrobetaine dioxygenase